MLAELGWEPNATTPTVQAAWQAALDRVYAHEHTPVPYFGAILKHAGRPHVLRPIELGQVRKTEQARTFAAYSATSTTDPKERT
ncbi:hypothetical protein [Streptomyces sp. NPDC101237]|uniref:hypothetical protein n=1 Tax=Streptomyces sp. NPDC101237 TaxID=3366139 RepID=UPI003804465D